MQSINQLLSPNPVFVGFSLQSNQVNLLFTYLLTFGAVDDYYVNENHIRMRM